MFEYDYLPPMGNQSQPVITPWELFIRSGTGSAAFEQREEPVSGSEALPGQSVAPLSTGSAQAQLQQDIALILPVWQAYFARGYNREDDAPIDTDPSVALETALRGAADDQNTEPEHIPAPFTDALKPDWLDYLQAAQSLRRQWDERTKQLLERPLNLLNQALQAVPEALRALQPEALMSPEEEERENRHGLLVSLTDDVLAAARAQETETQPEWNTVFETLQKKVFFTETLFTLGTLRGSGIVRQQIWQLETAIARVKDAQHEAGKVKAVIRNLLSPVRPAREYGNQSAAASVHFIQRGVKQRIAQASDPLAALARSMDVLTASLQQAKKTLQDAKTKRERATAETELQVKALNKPDNGEAVTVKQWLGGQLRKAKGNLAEEISQALKGVNKAAPAQMYDQRATHALMNTRRVSNALPVFRPEDLTVTARAQLRVAGLILLEENARLRTLLQQIPLLTRELLEAEAKRVVLSNAVSSAGYRTAGLSPEENRVVAFLQTSTGNAAFASKAATDARSRLRAALENIAILSDASKQKAFREYLYTEADLALKPVPEGQRETARKAVTALKQALDSGLNTLVEAADRLVATGNQALIATEARTRYALYKKLNKAADAAGLDVGVAREHLKQRIMLLTGRTLHSYSRGGMLARGMAEWAQAEKAALVRAGIEEAAADAAIRRVLMNTVQENFIRVTDPGARLLQKRIDIALDQAASGTLRWPATAEERRARSGSFEDYLLRWAGRQLSGSLVRSLLFGVPQLAINTITLIPRQTIALTSSALQWALGTRRLYQGIRPGEVIPRGVIASHHSLRMRRMLFRQIASLMPGPLRLLLGLAVAGYAVRQGGWKATLTEAGKALPTEIPLSAGWYLVRQTMPKPVSSETDPVIPEAAEDILNEFKATLHSGLQNEDPEQLGEQLEAMRNALYNGTPEEVDEPALAAALAQLMLDEASSPQQVTEASADQRQESTDAPSARRSGRAKRSVTPPEATDITPLMQTENKLNQVLADAQKIAERVEKKEAEIKTKRIDMSLYAQNHRNSHRLEGNRLVPVNGEYLRIMAEVYNKQMEDLEEDQRLLKEQQDALNEELKLLREEFKKQYEASRVSAWLETHWKNRGWHEPPYKYRREGMTGEFYQPQDKTANSGRFIYLNGEPWKFEVLNDLHDVISNTQGEKIKIYYDEKNLTWGFAGEIAPGVKQENAEEDKNDVSVSSWVGKNWKGKGWRGTPSFSRKEGASGYFIPTQVTGAGNYIFFNGEFWPFAHKGSGRAEIRNTSGEKVSIHYNNKLQRWCIDNKKPTVKIKREKSSASDTQLIDRVIVFAREERRSAREITALRNKINDQTDKMLKYVIAANKNGGTLDFQNGYLWSANEDEMTSEAESLNDELYSLEAELFFWENQKEFFGLKNEVLRAELRERLQAQQDSSLINEEYVYQELSRARKYNNQKEQDSGDYREKYLPFWNKYDYEKGVLSYIYKHKKHDAPPREDRIAYLEGAIKARDELMRDVKALNEIAKEATPEEQYQIRALGAVQIAYLNDIDTYINKTRKVLRAGDKLEGWSEFFPVLEQIKKDPSNFKIITDMLKLKAVRKYFPDEKMTDEECLKLFERLENGEFINKGTHVDPDEVVILYRLQAYLLNIYLGSGRNYQGGRAIKYAINETDVADLANFEPEMLKGPAWKYAMGLTNPDRIKRFEDEHREAQKYGNAGEAFKNIYNNYIEHHARNEAIDLAHKYLMIKVEELPSLEKTMFAKPRKIIEYKLNYKMTRLSRSISPRLNPNELPNKESEGELEGSISVVTLDNDEKYILSTVTGEMYIKKCDEITQRNLDMLVMQPTLSGTMELIYQDKEQAKEAEEKVKKLNEEVFSKPGDILDFTSGIVKGGEVEPDKYFVDYFIDYYEEQLKKLANKMKEAGGTYSFAEFFANLIPFFETLNKKMTDETYEITLEDLKWDLIDLAVTISSAGAGKVLSTLKRYNEILSYVKSHLKGAGAAFDAANLNNRAKRVTLALLRKEQPGLKELGKDLFAFATDAANPLGFLSVLRLGAKGVIHFKDFTLDLFNKRFRFKGDINKFSFSADEYIKKFSTGGANNGDPYEIEFIDELTEEEIKLAKASLPRNFETRLSHTATAVPDGQNQSAVAAEKVVDELRNNNHPTRIISCLIYPDGLIAPPVEHYAVLVIADGKELVIDAAFNELVSPSLRQGKAIITSRENWMRESLEASKNQKRSVLIKEFDELPTAKSYIKHLLQDQKIKPENINQSEFKRLDTLVMNTDFYRLNTSAPVTAKLRNVLEDSGFGKTESIESISAFTDNGLAEVSGEKRLLLNGRSFPVYKIESNNEAILKIEKNKAIKIEYNNHQWDISGETVFQANVAEGENFASIISEGYGVFAAERTIGDIHARVTSEKPDLDIPVIKAKPSYSLSYADARTAELLPNVVRSQITTGQKASNIKGLRRTDYPGIYKDESLNLYICLNQTFYSFEFLNPPDSGYVYGEGPAGQVFIYLKKVNNRWIEGIDYIEANVYQSLLHKAKYKLRGGFDRYSIKGLRSTMEPGVYEDGDGNAYIKINDKLYPFIWGETDGEAYMYERNKATDKPFYIKKEKGRWQETGYSRKKETPVTDKVFKDIKEILGEGIALHEIQGIKTTADPGIYIDNQSHTYMRVGERFYKFEYSGGMETGAVFVTRPEVYEFIYLKKVNGRWQNNHDI